MKQQEESANPACAEYLTVAKEIKWEAAHRLVAGYPGNCAHNHGHSWVATVTLGLRPTASTNSFGFVKDYHDFKELKTWVDDMWDHATLVNAQDASFIEWLVANNQRYVTFDGNPTSELLVKELFKKAQVLLEDGRAFVVETKLKETCTSEATYKGNRPMVQTSWETQNRSFVI